MRPDEASAFGALNLACLHAILEPPAMPTPQSPIGSGFGAASTAADVLRGIDLHGKNVVVTGGDSGIGLETVSAMRAAGAKGWVPVRDIAKGRAALRDMPDVELAPMDLLDPVSIDAFARAVTAA